MNSPVDQALLQLVHQNVYSFENNIKNWPDELREEKDKVQQQLQVFHSEINERSAKLVAEQQRLKTGQERMETEQQSLKTGHQRLEAEQHSLKTGHQRLENDQQRLETEQQRLDSHSRDIEQRVIKCEGTLNFVRKGMM